MEYRTHELIDCKMHDLTEKWTVMLCKSRHVIRPRIANMTSVSGVYCDMFRLHHECTTHLTETILQGNASIRHQLDGHLTARLMKALTRAPLGGILPPLWFFLNIKRTAARSAAKFSVTTTKVFELDYNISSEWFTVHYILGETSDHDWVGLTTVSFTF